MFPKKVSLRGKMVPVSSFSTSKKEEFITPTKVPKNEIDALGAVHMAVLLHHVTVDKVYRPGNVERLVLDKVQAAYNWLVKQAFLTPVYASEDSEEEGDPPTQYKLTERGNVFVQHLLKQPLPQRVTTWVIEEESHEDL